MSGRLFDKLRVNGKGAAMEEMKSSCQLARIIEHYHALFRVIDYAAIDYALSDLPVEPTE